MSLIATDTRTHKYSFEGKKSKLKSLLKEGTLYFLLKKINKNVNFFKIIKKKQIKRSILNQLITKVIQHYTMLVYKVIKIALKFYYPMELIQIRKLNGGGQDFKIY